MEGEPLIASFPVLRVLLSRNDLTVPFDVPWGFVEPHRERCFYNHGQTLERLRERGGLSPRELVVLVTDRPWSYVWNITEEEGVEQLSALLTKWEATHPLN